MKHFQPESRLRAVLAMGMDYVRATRIAAAVGQGLAALLGLLGLVAAPMHPPAVHGKGRDHVEDHQPNVDPQEPRVERPRKRIGRDRIQSPGSEHPREQTFC